VTVAREEAARAAQRSRGEAPAVAGGIAFTLRQPGGQDKRPFSAAWRVGSTELLGRPMRCSRGSFLVAACPLTRAP